MGRLKHKPYVEIYLQTFQDTLPEDFGKQMFSLIWQEDPLLAPQKFGPTTRNRKSYINIDQMMSFWPRDIEVWKRDKKLKNLGVFLHSEQTNFGLNPGVLTLKSDYSPEINWLNKFEDLCMLFKPELGMMHLYTEFECRKENSTRDFREANFGSIWSPTIPGLGWVFVAGGKYYKDLKESALSFDGIELIDSGDYIVFKIAKSDAEIIKKYNDFHNRRASLIGELPKRHFSSLKILNNPQNLEINDS